MTEKETTQDIKAIIFDIDGTLTSESSWNSITPALGASLEMHLDLYGRFKKGEISDHEVVETMTKEFKKSGKANKENILNVFENVPIRDGVEEIVPYLKEKYHVMMITGAMDAYAEIISRKTGIEDYAWNTKIHWDEDGYLDRFEYYSGQEELKLKQLKEYCEEKGIAVEQCAAVGDSWNDVHLFDATGNGIFIESKYEDRDLEKHAWQTIHELPELKAFL